MITIEPIRTDEERKLLVEAAADDKHLVLWPTHLGVKDGEIVGYASVFAIPVVMVWVHSAKVSPLETHRALEHLDNSLRFNGVKQYLMTCSTESPFYKVMGRLGFTEIGPTVFFHRTMASGLKAKL